jgi:acyl carrier protein
VITIDDFIALVQDEVGLPVTTQHANLHFDEVPGWDSVHLLSLLTALERKTGQTVSLPAILEASSLADIYSLTVQR